MEKVFFFVQIILATTIGSLVASFISEYSSQCLSKDSNECAETRVECVFNSYKTPFVIQDCLLGKDL